MSTKLRPELSDKNKYWIDKHRFYELKHFCLQYPTWKKALRTVEGLKGRSMDGVIVQTSGHSDDTAHQAIVRAYYSDRVNMIEDAALKADSELANYILKGVTEGISFDHLNARLEIPCSRDDRYRRFFWILSQSRK